MATKWAWYAAQLQLVVAVSPISSRLQAPLQPWRGPSGAGRSVGLAMMLGALWPEIYGKVLAPDVLEAAGA